MVCEIPDIVDGLQLGLLLALQVRFEGPRVLLTWRMMSLVVLPGVKLGRVVLCSSLVLKRFDLVNRVYGGIVDEKTKKPLFRPEALEAIKQLRVNIAMNCISDPPDIQLYFEHGRDAITGTPGMRR